MRVIVLFLAGTVMIAGTETANAFSPVGCFSGATTAFADPLDRDAEAEGGREIDNGRSAYFLAESYALGRGVEQDLGRSQALYAFAAEHTEGAMAKSAACHAAGVGRLIIARQQQAQPASLALARGQ